MPPLLGTLLEGSHQSNSSMLPEACPFLRILSTPLEVGQGQPLVLPLATGKCSSVRFDTRFPGHYLMSTRKPIGKSRMLRGLNIQHRQVSFRADMSKTWVFGRTLPSLSQISNPCVKIENESGKSRQILPQIYPTPTPSQCNRQPSAPFFSIGETASSDVWTSVQRF